MNTRTGRFLSVLALSLLGLGLAVLLLEVGLRVYLTNYGRIDQKIRYLYTWDQIAASPEIQFDAVPFLNHGTKANTNRHNSLGYPGDEISIPKPDGVYRVVALGGSTTYSGELLETSEDYPAQLEQILREEYGYDQVEVINAGVPNYSTWNTLVNFQFRVLDLQPDLVIVYHGVNDLSARAVFPDRYIGLPPNDGYWDDDPFNLGPSVLWRFVSYRLGWMPDASNLGNHLRPYQPDLNCCGNLSHEAVARHFEANPPIYFERNLRNLIAIADLQDIEVMLSTWTYYPEAVDDGPGLNLMTLEYRQEAIAQQNTVLANLANETGVLFYDFAAAIPLDPSYWVWDGVHRTAEGTSIQAELYADFLHETGILGN